MKKGTALGVALQLVDDPGLNAHCLNNPRLQSGV